MPTHSARMLAAILLLVGVRLCAQEGGSTPQPPPEKTAFPLALPVPGLQATDATPNACVDCHVQRGELDLRLSTRIAALGMGVPDELLAKARAAAPPGKELGGWHPQLPPEAFTNIPGACLRCHRRDAQKAPPFSQLVHLIHLTENSFTRDAGGGCGSCHKLDPASGQWTMPSGPER